MRLRDFLKETKCPLTEEAFRERLVDVFAEMFPGATDEEVFSNWRFNRDYGRAACRMVKIPVTPGNEYFVVHTVINIRKHGNGRLSLRERKGETQNGRRGRSKSKPNDRPPIHP